MRYSHRVMQYLQAKDIPAAPGSGLLSVCINTAFNGWEFTTNSKGNVGVGDSFLIYYTQVEDDDDRLAGTPLIHTWTHDEDDVAGMTYRYKILKNKLFGALDEDEYRQLIGTLIALDSYYCNPKRDITHVSWTVHANVEMPESIITTLPVPYLGTDVVEDFNIHVPVPEDPSYEDVSDT